MSALTGGRACGNDGRHPPGTGDLAPAACRGWAARSGACRTAAARRRTRSPARSTLKRPAESEAVLYAEGTGIVGAPDSRAAELDIAALARRVHGIPAAARTAYERSSRSAASVTAAASAACGRSTYGARGWSWRELEVKAGVVPGQYVHCTRAWPTAPCRPPSCIMVDADRGIANGAGAHVRAVRPRERTGLRALRTVDVGRRPGRHPVAMATSYKFDIDVCAEDGTVRARMRGLALPGTRRRIPRPAP
jgi:hypothetical protein